MGGRAAGARLRPAEPLQLRRALARARWSATLAVAFEFARRAAPSRELDEVVAFVLAHVAPAAGERFFRGTRAFGGGAGAARRRGVARGVRALGLLLAITMRDYLAALRGRASRRQATRDLATAGFLQRVGTTRGARYRLK